MKMIGMSNQAVVTPFPARSLAVAAQSTFHIPPTIEQLK